MSTTEQCRARTADGERCEHSAGEDGYCHQHDPDDPTADEVDEGNGGQDAGNTNSQNGDSQSAGGGTTDGTDGQQASDDGDSSGSSESTDSNGSADVSASASVSSDGASSGLVEVRNTARSVAGDLVEREVDGVVEVRNRDGEWTAVVEVVERHAVPDTQDILGRYEFDLDGDATVTGYRRVDRYRRGESDRDEF